MQDIIKEYGPALITVIAIIAMAGLVAMLFTTINPGGTGEVKGGVIGQKFVQLMTYFFDTASGKLGALGG